MILRKKKKRKNHHCRNDHHREHHALLPAVPRTTVKAQRIHLKVLILSYVLCLSVLSWGSITSSTALLQFDFICSTGWIALGVLQLSLGVGGGGGCAYQLRFRSLTTWLQSAIAANAAGTVDQQFHLWSIVRSSRPYSSNDAHLDSTNRNAILLGGATAAAPI